MTPRLFSTGLFFLCALAIYAQKIHLEPSVGLAISRMYGVDDDIPYTRPFPDRTYKKQWFGSRVYSLGFTLRTQRHNLQTWNLQYTYHNTGEPLTGVSGYYSGEYEVMRLALLFEQLYHLSARNKHNQFFIGITGAGGYDAFNGKSRSSNHYSNFSRSVNVESGGALRYHYQFKGGWRFFTNFGVAILSANWENYRNERLPEEQVETNSVEINLVPRWQLRIGVNIPLGPKPDTALSPSQ